LTIITTVIIIFATLATFAALVMLAGLVFRALRVRFLLGGLRLRGPVLRLVTFLVRPSPVDVRTGR
jgi:hypothetical protein